MFTKVSVHHMLSEYALKYFALEPHVHVRRILIFDTVLALERCDEALYGSTKED